MKKDGVIATLYDKRFTHETNRAGMIRFNNTNSYPVRISYQIYGIDSKKNKTLVDQGKQDFEAKQNPSWGYTYSYDDYQKYGQWQKYKEYACAIKVEKIMRDATGNWVTVNSSPMPKHDEVYHYLRDKKSRGEEFTQGDYTKAIVTLDGYAAVLKKVEQHLGKNPSSEKVKAAQKKYSYAINYGEWIYNMVEAAYKSGKLNSDNKQRWNKLHLKYIGESVG